MSERFFVSAPIFEDCVTLSGTEAHHLTVVGRHRPGDKVTLFDGTGAEFQARLRTVARDEVQLELLAHTKTSRELPGCLVLASALPKGDRQRWLVEKAVELGVTRFIPLLAERSVVRPRSVRLDRLRRTVIEASKQCGRNTLMEIDPPSEGKTVLASSSDSGLRWLADPSAASFDSVFADPMPSEARPGQITVAIGPEGGFTDEERAVAAQAGWTCYSLGPRILRIETAALAFCTLAAGFLSRGS